MFIKRIIVILIALFFSISSAVSKNKEYKKTNLHSDSLDVLNYSINLNITKFATKQISGNTKLTIVPKIENLDVISLDLLNFTIDSISAENNKIENFSYNDTLLNIYMETPMSISDTINITVYYNGKPQQDAKWGGFFYTSDCAYNMGVGMASDPVCFGRAWYPCIDDFVDRATYDFNITVKDEHEAICGGTLSSTTNNGDGTKTYHWKLHNTIPTYLSSVAVGNYIAIVDSFTSVSGNTIPIDIYVNPSDSASAVKTFKNLKQVLSGYESRFGKYPWERVGYVCVPFDGGAMEHATNIAYPISALDGSLSSETLYAHELSHHWFGDLVTCKTADDMWLNEGWASYCEAINKENLYGESSFIQYVNNNHKYVLKFAHINDDGYRAVSGVPHDYTYGTTVYDKGADVAHTLRGYLGDSLFFSGIKNYLSAFSYKSVSSEDFRDFLSENTGVDLTDFFQAWVFSPGFSHFSVDSFSVVNNGNEYETTVYVRQKLKEKTEFANSNRVELTFMDENWQMCTKTIFFSGETGNQTFSLNINPKIVMVDYNNKMGDANTNTHKTIKTLGSITFSNVDFSTIVLNITDSAFIRVEQNWVSPDGFKTIVPHLLISGFDNYWKVDGMLPDNFSAKGKFYYDFVNEEEKPEDGDSLILLYRKSAANNWREISNTWQGFLLKGSFTTDSLLLGEYALGYWDLNAEINDNELNEENSLHIFPNPSTDKFTFKFNLHEDAEVSIFDILGKPVLRQKIDKQTLSFNWHPENNSKGIYIVKLKEKNKAIISKKIIIK
ncbi:MAG: T9SS type A sorting domain-containing protein [Bacteroidales bacterium]|nr:T9SS type A sorting domain-containing protein [Bacteroidales bacterium]